jgi:hypothetical protein
VTRNPARLGKKDSNHRAIAEALKAIGCPVMDLSHAGNGVEDLLVGVRRKMSAAYPWWLVVECKVGKPRFTAAQKKWREQTSEWPRLTVTSAQQAVDEVRRMGG